MYENVKSLDYTKKSLQSDSDPATMEVVTRTNAVKSPTNSPETTKLVYTVKEVAQMLAISQRAAYNPVSYTHLKDARMGVAVDGLCPPSAGLQRNQWCTFSRPAAAAFFPYKAQGKRSTSVLTTVACKCPRF